MKTFGPWLARLVFGALLALPVIAQAQSEAIGVIVMHGKNGQPGRHVGDLASALERQGFRVANLEMPWSNRHQYAPPVARGEEQVAAAIAELKKKGAAKIFIAGHSLGGSYALHAAGRQPLDGAILIAPGGNVALAGYRKNIAPAMDRAQQLVAEGKGQESAALQDYEGGRGYYSINTIPASFLAWNDLDGPFNMDRSAAAVKVPVLFILPKRDYPALLRTGPTLFRKLPSHPQTRLYEPDADHLGAPYASIDEIAKWLRSHGA